MEPKKRGGKKGRKIGRNAAKCQRYRAQARRERNKRRKIAKHARGNPNDAQALALLK